MSIIFLSYLTVPYRYDWAISLSLFTFMHWRRKWQPTPVFLPGESQGRGSLVGCRLWGRTGSDTTEVTLTDLDTFIYLEKRILGSRGKRKTPCWLWYIKFKTLHWIKALPLSFTKIVWMSKNIKLSEFLVFI